MNKRDGPAGTRRRRATNPGGVRHPSPDEPAYRRSEPRFEHARCESPATHTLVCAPCPDGCRSPLHAQRRQRDGDPFADAIARVQAGERKSGKSVAGARRFTEGIGRHGIFRRRLTADRYGLLTLREVALTGPSGACIANPVEQPTPSSHVIVCIAPSSLDVGRRSGAARRDRQPWLRAK